MSPEIVGILSIITVIVLIACKVHVGLVLGLVGFLGFWFVTGNLDAAIGVLWTTPYQSTAQFALAVLPLFILMGTFAGYAGLAEDAYEAIFKFVGHLRGGMALATIGANAIFGAASGSSAAACAVFTKFAFPEMTKRGYERHFSCATIASAGVLAMLIPPSVLMIMYGLITNVSIATLFVAGIVPGIMLSVMYGIGVLVWLKINPELAPTLEVPSSWKDRFTSMYKIWGTAILMFIVLGGIYGGFFTATEAGAAGAAGALLLALIMRKIKRDTFWSTLKDSAQTTGIIFFIYVGAQIYSKFLAISQLPQVSVDWLQSISPPPLVILASFVVIYLILGCLLDSISMMLITLPIMFPISEALKWDPIWFAIVLIMAIEAGLLTPPVGINVYVVKAAAGPGVDLMKIFGKSTPYFFVMLLCLAIIIAFPGLVTFLPNLMGD